ncbi:hypothetical protein WJX74_000671 [Apatococcus lobatus]|uniref:Plasma membrane fusion protein PRM1 n=1 Tax=Apatococcus lobatus TaxID=904363 RepID=A0AAW1RSI0_9CHLO
MLRVLVSLALSLLLLAFDTVGADGVAVSVANGRTTVTTTGSGSSNDACPNAQYQNVAWLSTPTPRDQYQPDPRETQDFQSYIKQLIKTKFLPAEIVFVLSLIFFLFFILWRIFHAFALCCCPKCCCWGTCTSYTEQDPIRHVYGRWFAAMKTFSILFAIGLIASCIYGMAKSGPHVVQNAYSTMDGVKGYASGLIGIGESAVASADDISSALATIQSIVSNQIEFQTLLSETQCLATFLDGIPSPMDMFNNLTNVQTRVSSGLQPDLAMLTANISILQTTEVPQAQTAAATFTNIGTLVSNYSGEAGRYSSAASSAASQSSFDNSGNNGVDQAIADLQNPAGGNTGNLNSMVTALTIYQQLGSNSTLADVGSNIQAVIYDVNNITSIVNNTVTQFNRLTAAYSLARPCLLNLTNQLTTINTTVVVLPSNVNAALNLLTSTQSVADALLSSTTFITQVNDNVQSAFSQTSFLTGLQSTLSSIQSYVRDSARSTVVTASKSQFQNSATYSAYADGWLATAVSAKAANDFPSWKTAVGDARTDYDLAVANGTTQLPRLFSTFNAGGGASPASSFNSIGTAISGYLSSVPSASSTGSLLSGASTSAAGVAPALSRTLNNLNAAVGVFNALPSPRSALVTPIQGEINSLSNTITSSIANAQSSVSSGVSTLDNQLPNVRKDSVGRIDAFQQKTKPDVDKIDKWRKIGEYIYFGLGIVVALVLIGSVWFFIPFWLKLFAAILSILTILNGLLGLLFLIVVVIGNDTCYHMEPYALERVSDSLIEDYPGGSWNTTMSLAEYYLYNQGSNFTMVFSNSFGVNLPSIQAQLQQAKTQYIQTITSSYTLLGQLSSTVAGISNSVDSINSDLTSFQTTASYSGVHPQYLAVKGYICCTVLSFTWDMWVAVFASAIFSLLLMVCLFNAIHRMDRIPRKACCGCSLRNHKEFMVPDMESPATSRAAQQALQHARTGMGADRIDSHTSLVAPEPMIPEARQGSYPSTPGTPYSPSYPNPLHAAARGSVKASGAYSPSGTPVRERKPLLGNGSRSRNFFGSAQG